MALDPVPWLVAGGAVHSSEVSRVLSYVATGGSQGVAESADCAVKALAVPGASVVVKPGAFGIRNSYPGQTSQTYMGRAISDTNVVIAATAGAIRSDMIIMRIDDPYYGGSVPPSIPDGPYLKLEVLSNVGAGATVLPGSVTYPAIILARIDIPASTATITNAMIVDLRTLIRPRKERSLKIYQPAGSTVLTAVHPAYMNWPSAAGWPIDIPAWATSVVVIAHLGGIKFLLPGGAGAISARLGTDGNAVQTQYTSYDLTDGGGYSREAILAAGTLAIPAAYRGTTQTLAVRGALTVVPSNATRADADAGSTTVVDWEFIEVPVVP